MYYIVASPLAYQAFFQLLKERGKERRRHNGESAASGRWKEGEEGGEGGEEGEGGEGELLIDLFFFCSSYLSSYFSLFQERRVHDQSESPIVTREYLQRKYSKK